MKRLDVKPVGMLCLLLMAIGCSVASQPNYSKLGLVEVSGQVKLDGNPLTNATIEFVNEQDQTFSFGYLDASGNYSLMFDSRVKGIIPGEKAIRIRPGLPAGMSEMQANESIEQSGDTEDPDAKTAAGAAVPACYKQIGKLKVTITDTTSSLNFNLKSDCSTTSAE